MPQTGDNTHFVCRHCTALWWTLYTVHHCTQNTTVHSTLLYTEHNCTQYTTVHRTKLYSVHHCTQNTTVHSTPFETVNHCSQYTTAHSTLMVHRTPLHFVQPCIVKHITKEHSTVQHCADHDKDLCLYYCHFTFTAYCTILHCTTINWTEHTSPLCTALTRHCA